MVVLNNNNTVEVIWSGGAYALCCGEWDVKVNGISLDIPEDKKHSEMDTEGDYPQWHFENWEEVWETVHCGLPKEKWLEENKDWLTEAIQKTGLKFSEGEMEELLSTIHDEIQGQDWIHGMCGGCV